MQRRVLQDLVERTRRWAESRAHVFTDPAAYLSGVEDALQRLGAAVLADGAPEHPAYRGRDADGDATDEAGGFVAAVARVAERATVLASSGTTPDAAVDELREVAGRDRAVLLTASRQRGGAPGAPPGHGPADLLLAAVPPDAGGRASRHRVTFYDRSERLVDEVAAFVDPALRGSGGHVVVVARSAQRKQLRTRLNACGRQVARARLEGRYLELDAAATLDELIRDGRPDPGRFRELVRPPLETAAEQGTPALVYGEMVALLWGRGETDTAIELEGLWNELARDVPFELLCSYPAHIFDAPGDAAALRAVCGHHDEVIPAAG
jgi:hypothetical protein